MFDNKYDRINTLASKDAARDQLARRRISQGVSEDTETSYISCIVDGVRYYAMTTLGQCNVKSALVDAMTIEDWWAEWWDEMHFEVI